VRDSFMLSSSRVFYLCAQKIFAKMDLEPRRTQREAAY
jgi:hypothetical protein